MGSVIRKDDLSSFDLCLGDHLKTSGKVETQFVTTASPPMPGSVTQRGLCIVRRNRHLARWAKAFMGLTCRVSARAFPTQSPGKTPVRKIHMENASQC